MARADAVWLRKDTCGKNVNVTFTFGGIEYEIPSDNFNSGCEYFGLVRRHGAAIVKVG